MKKDTQIIKQNSRTFSYEEKKQQLAQIKSQINLTQYLKRLGYKTDNKKSSQKWAIMQKGTDKIMVLTQKNDQGQYYYQSLNDETDKGTIVDFLLNRGHSLDQIRNLTTTTPQQLLKKSSQQAPETKQVDQKASKSLATKKLNSIIPNYKQNHLIDRGIKKEIIQKYTIKTDKEKAIFPLLLKNQLVSTIEYNKKGKFFQKGLSRGLVYLGDLNKAKYIIIHESPIDALSYEQLAIQSGDHTQRLHVSTCGSLTKHIKQEIQNLYKNNNKKIIIAFDNDTKGDEMATKLKATLGNKKIIRQKVKKGKDFNELLASPKKKG